MTAPLDEWGWFCTHQEPRATLPLLVEANSCGTPRLPLLNELADSPDPQAPDTVADPVQLLRLSFIAILRRNSSCTLSPSVERQFPWYL